MESLQVVSECLAIRLRLCTRVITSLYDKALRPHGLRVTQYSILAALDRVQAATPTQLGEWLVIEPSTISRTVARMQDKGWVEALAEADARSHKLRLTHVGRTLLKLAWPAWASAQQEATVLLGVAGCQSVQQLSRRLWAHDPSTR